MARKYELKPNYYAWLMERCEDRLLIAEFDDIEGRIAADQSWKRDFTDHFYMHGNGIAFRFIAAINAVRRRLGRPVFNFEETNIYDYGRISDRLQKSELRRQMREEYLGLDTPGRIRWRQNAEDEIAALPPPHYTHEEWKNMRRQRYGGTVLTSAEIVTRAQAVAQSQPQRTTAKPDDKARVITQLKLVQPLPDNSALISEILAKLKPDDALDIASDFDDPGIRAALVRHSLAA
jgi:hypothetical protein